MPAPTLVIQTTYAELLERCAAAAFDSAFPDDGTFTSKLIRERRYWYFQVRTRDGARVQRYVGPETPELLERIHHHRQARDDERERRALVSTLVRSFGLPAPLPAIGEVIGALARAGVFRLRGVLVGTVAYQSYPVMLGVKLSNALLQTSDVDIAQFTNISVTVGEQTPPMLGVLKAVDPSFRETPHLSPRGAVTGYYAKGGLRVDFLTPNEGTETDAAQPLPALQTSAQPLRFLDFLIHDPVPAALLHGPGAYVMVPTPERYAVHKLIVGRRRSVSAGKRDKDLNQAEALLAALLDKRRDELRLTWEEAYARGAAWRKLLLGGLAEINADVRDRLLQLSGRTRDSLTGMDLQFDDTATRYDSTREAVSFSGKALGTPVQCSVSRETLEDHYGARDANRRGLIDAFRRHRAEIEALLRKKYLTWPVEEAGRVVLKTLEVEKLAQ
jgi:hypothetical protein